MKNTKKEIFIKNEKKLKIQKLFWKMNKNGKDVQKLR